MHRLRWVLSVVLVAVGLLGTAILHQLHEGALATEACDAALARGDLRAAIDAAHDAAEAAAPGSPYPERGFVRLESIARAAEARTDDATATAAWRAMRAAAAATRWLGPTSARFALANEALARLAWRDRAGAARTGDPDEHRRAIVEPLARDEAPAAGTFLLLGAGTLAFFVGAARLCVLPAFTLRAAARWAGLAAAGLLLCVVACLRG